MEVSEFWQITLMHAHKIKKLFQCIQFRTLSENTTLLRQKAANDWGYPWYSPSVIFIEASASECVVQIKIWANCQVTFQI